MSNDMMIRVEGVDKEYRLGVIGGTTLREELQRLGAKLRKKDDPTRIIGQASAAMGDRFMALSDLNFEVRRGEAVGIIGHNGAGKSTLLKLITRVTAPTAGNIYLNGRVASMLEVGTGFHPELTGRENVYMNGAILGMTKAEIDRKLEEIIEFSEVRQFIDTPVKRYSSGMYVKLAFSVAAHLDSEIVIMDEVLAVGDMAFQKKCLSKMREAAKKEGRTVLYVSHNMNTIRQLCDRCIVLEKGKIVFDGGVEEAISVYMNQEDQTTCFYDFSESKRTCIDEPPLLLLSAEILGREKNEIRQGEDLPFRLRCRVLKDVKDVGFRFEIFSLDDMIVGTCFSDRRVTAEAGQEITLSFSLPTKNFAPAKFRVVALAYETDSYGNETFFDRVDPAMYFEVLPPSEDSLVWLHQHWGYVRFDDMELLEISSDHH